MFVIHANLDAEARWASGSLPGSIATRVSYYAALLSVLAPDDEVEVWAPAAIDASRLIASPAWRPPTMRVGTPPRADLVWARAEAKAANDRRLALTIAHELGVGLANARVVSSLDELVEWTDEHASSLVPGASMSGASMSGASSARWVAKAPWTTAGRDRCHGEGAPTDEQRTRITRLLAKFGALVVEPWVERVFDVGLCARIDEFRPRTTANNDMHALTSATSATSGTSGARSETPDFYVTLSDPHSLITDARGTFLGIDLTAPALLPHEATQLGVTAREVGARLAAIGFRGPFAIDAFVYRAADGARRFHPLCEINARHTFGHVARAFEARGFARLGFGAPPDGANVLVALANDGVTAWVS